MYPSRPLAWPVISVNDRAGTRWYRIDPESGRSHAVGEVTGYDVVNGAGQRWWHFARRVHDDRPGQRDGWEEPVVAVDLHTGATATLTGSAASAVLTSRNWRYASPSGRFAGRRTNDGQLILVDAVSGQVREYTTRAVAFSPDETQAVIDDGDQAWLLDPAEPDTRQALRSSGLRERARHLIGVESTHRSWTWVEL